MNDLNNILERYKLGYRYFINLEFENGEVFTGIDFRDAIFDGCFFAVSFLGIDFTNAKFINCNLKTSDFCKCNLTNVVFENCLLEHVEFLENNINHTVLVNCSCYGQPVTLNKTTGVIEAFMTPLVKELYKHIPEFSEIASHHNDNLEYAVYGELPQKLLVDITTHNEVTDFTKKCF